MTKQEYKDTVKYRKAEFKKDLEKLKLEYENSGDHALDAMNSIYARKIFYRITYKNIKRDGIIKFFWNKFLTERKYRFFKAINRPANLSTYPLNYPKMSEEYVNKFPVVGADNRRITKEAIIAGEKLLQKELKQEKITKKVKNGKQ